MTIGSKILVEGNEDGPRVIDLDAGRRAFMRSLGIGAAGAALIGGASAGLIQPASAQAITDVDIANFALNLEYLEAEFYLRAAFGTGLTNADITGSGNLGGVTGGRKVAFKSKLVSDYAVEIALDEQNHVRYLRSATAPNQVARPALDIGGAFNTAAQAASIVGPGQTFDAYASDVNFLFAAYIFEDVGVTAYSGAAPLITSKAILAAAAGVLAVEAYHAGLIRTSLYAMQINMPKKSAAFKTTAGISNLRRALSGANDDQGIGPDQSTLAGGSATPSNIVPTDGNGLAFARSTRQVLNIVYGAPNAASGLFFPNGMNGTIR